MTAFLFLLKVIIMKYKNPIIRGFNPDPSVCRVGSDYYLVTSSFEYFPGIPVYHSTDLVNWELIGHCINRTSQLPMNEAQSSGGVWAPTIRYDNGTFYVTATFSGKGNFIMQTDNPRGPWSDPVWVEMDGIDPSMFFEDGKMYYCANDCGERQKKYSSEGISVAQIDPETGKIIGETVRIWTGTGGGFLEAPHIYHIGDWYYVIAAEGGTGLNHMVTAARCREIMGEYEPCPYNPVLTNRGDTSKQIACAGHADLIDDKNGNWWLVHLGTRPANNFLSHLGRETFLTPVVWENEWFFVEGKKAVINVSAPVLAEQKRINEWSAKFTENEYDKHLIFLKNPFWENYQCENGCLTLVSTTVKITDKNLSPTFIAVRPIDFDSETDIEFEFEPRSEGDEAGAAIYLTPDFMYRICKRRGADGDYITIIKTADDFTETAYNEKIENGTVRIKIKASKSHYEFYYSVGENDFQYATAAATRFLSCELAGRCFTGVLTGIYAQSENGTGAEAKFYRFTQKCLS